MHRIYFTFFLLLGWFTTLGQYNVNGSAIALANECFRLTSNMANQEGSFFATQQINLNEPFDLYTRIDFGFNDATGGSGVAFSFQQFSTAVVQPGGSGLGIVGTTPSLVVEFDTDQDAALNDPAFDHMALSRNGALNHSSPNNLVGPVGITPTNANVETGMDHEVHIRWNPTSQLFQVWVDCDLRISYTGDIINTFFSGDPNVFWGFSASSGANTNLQDVCIDFFNQDDQMTDVTLCEGTPHLASAGIGNTFQWSPTAGLSSATAQSPTATPSTTTNYTVTVTDNCGVTRQDSFTYTVLDSVIATLSGDTISCPGTVVPVNVNFTSGNSLFLVSLFDGTNLYNYVLDSNGIDTTTNLPPQFPVGAGSSTYNVFSITNEFGCGGAATGTVTVDSDILAGIQTTINEPTCNGLCNGSAQVQIPHDNGSYNFFWSNGDIGTTATNLCAGNYDVTITNGGGCSEVVNVVVTEPSVITNAPLPDVSICPGTTETLSLTLFGGTPPYNYNWSTGDNTQNITVSPSVSTTYSVTATDANNCPVIVETATVSVLPPFAGSVDQNIGTCIGGSVSFSAYASGGDGNYTFNWSNGAGGAIQNLTPDTSGVYTVTITDGCGSTPFVDSITVQVDTFPTHTYSVENPICIGQPATFVLDEYDPEAFYLFNFGDGILGIANSSTISHTYNTIDTFDVTLEVRTDYCDSIRTDTDLVVVQPVPRARFDVLPDEVFTISNPLATFNSTTVNATNWIWSIDGIRTSDQPSFFFDFRDSGTYNVELIAFNALGCADTTSQEVRVGYEYPNFFIPNSFTPNGDGLNDEFGPVINERVVANYEFLVFNRLGDLVFSTSDPTVYWNGKRDNSGAMSGQDFFWWKVTYNDIDFESHEYQGKVTLIK